MGDFYQTADSVPDNAKLMTRDLNHLKSSFDVVIIGGGISGAWLALHSSQQGFKTALIEQSDFASQTSSASSKLLHSGIRYLQQMQFGRVRESAIERANFIYAAPHLSTSVPFAVPTYKDFARSKLFLNCGMLAYRMLCIGENSIIASKEQKLAPIKSISAQQLDDICPVGDEQNTGAVVFHERHMQDSERMVWEILQTAQHAGAVVVNHVRAEKILIEENKTYGVSARDQLSNENLEIKSRVVVNAAGPWIDELNIPLNSSTNKQSINGFAVGSHIVCRQISDHAIAITTKLKSDTKIDRGGRHIFIIPWRGFSLVGTSYDEIKKPRLDMVIQPSHAQQLIQAVNDTLPDIKLTRDDLISGYSGLYPLKTDNIKSQTYQGSGEYQIIDHAKSDNIEGMITALGAKYTTGRKLSSLAIPIVANKLGKASQTITKSKLKCSQYSDLSTFKKAKLEQYIDRFSKKLLLHLITTYGSNIDNFIDSLNDSLLTSVCQSQADILGQIKWAIDHEQAYLLNDVLFGRTSLGLLGISDNEIETIALFMAKELSWSDDFLQQQLQGALQQQQEIKESLDAAYQLG